MAAPTPAHPLAAQRPTAPPGSVAAAALDAHLRSFGRDEPQDAEDVRLETLGDLLRFRQAQGAAAVAAVRAAPARLHAVELGRWFAAARRSRLARRALLAAPALGRALPRTPSVLAALVDAAFWRGVRSVADAPEWHRWTATSYTVLMLHRVADPTDAAEERLCISETQLRRLLRVLRLARFRLVGADEVLGLHTGSGVLGRRSVLLTVDDAFLDAVDALLHARVSGAIVFVPTRLVGGRVPWSADGLVAGWDDVRRLGRAGLHVGSHTRTHPVLPSLSDEDLERELGGSRADLSGRVERTLPALAYPHGRYDRRVCASTRDAGYAIAFTTDPGRNGAGTDPLCLRRVAVKEWDGALSLVWKAATGEPVPTWWERWSRRRARRLGTRA